MLATVREWMNRRETPALRLALLMMTGLAMTCHAVAAADASGASPASDAGFGFFNAVEFHVQGEAGVLGNSANPSQGLNGLGFNFGQLYTDHANTFLLNQILVTVTKPVDPNATGYAFGFTGQALYGSDMRVNHYLGIGTFSMAADRNQVNLVQAFAAAHLPLLAAGGIDVKLGLFVSPQGRESLDPAGNPFYSHSYIDNYGTTFNHTGILTTTHINSTADFYLGIDTGEQNTFGATFPGNRSGDFGDPNGAPAGIIGFGLNNLIDNKLTVLAISHIGPEQAPNSDPVGYKHDLRAYNDAYLTYTVTGKLSYTAEVDYTRDAYGSGTGPAQFYSVSQYVLYAYNDLVTFKARGEVARDTKDFFVSTPLTNSGLQLAEQGFPGPSLAGPGAGTAYGEITLGITIKPSVPKPLALLMFRPEIRFDRILAGAPLYGAQTQNGFYNGSRNQFTFGGDLVAGF